MSASDRTVSGRSSSGLAATLREEITSGRRGAGSYLPPERKLAKANRIAPITARRALKVLEAEGLVTAEPRKGYRVTARANDPDRGAPLAYVVSPHAGVEVWDALHREKVAALQEAATSLGWSLLAVGTEGRSDAQVMEQLRAARTCGAIIDVREESLFDVAREDGLPVVSIDEWRRNVEVDAVVQDGFKGGVLAATHLLEQGCRKIAWLGSMGTGQQSLERYGGAMSVLNAEGVEVPGKLRLRLSGPEDPEAVRLCREILGGKDRPEAFLALWQGCTRSLVAAAGELGLTPGRDFKMVGWSTEDEYESIYLPQFAGGPVPPALTWDVGVMARTAISRLAERRTNRELPVIKLKVPVRIRHHAERECKENS